MKLYMNIDTTQSFVELIRVSGSRSQIHNGIVLDQARTDYNKTIQLKQEFIWQQFDFTYRNIEITLEMLDRQC